jgi:hypothetical protein
MAKFNGPAGFDRPRESRQQRDARLANVDEQWRAAKPKLTDEAEKWGNILQVIQRDDRCETNDCRIALKKAREILAAMRQTYDRKGKESRKKVQRGYGGEFDQTRITQTLEEKIAFLQERIQSVETTIKGQSAASTAITAATRENITSTVSAAKPARSKHAPSPEREDEILESLRRYKNCDLQAYSPENPGDPFGEDYVVLDMLRSDVDFPSVKLDFVCQDTANRSMVFKGGPVAVYDFIKHELPKWDTRYGLKGFRAVKKPPESVVKPSSPAQSVNAAAESCEPSPEEKSAILASLNANLQVRDQDTIEEYDPQKHGSDNTNNHGIAIHRKSHTKDRIDALGRIGSVLEDGYLDYAVGDALSETGRSVLYKGWKSDVDAVWKKFQQEFVGLGLKAFRTISVKKTENKPSSDGKFSRLRSSFGRM